jgi:hypothetical protein
VARSAALKTATLHVKDVEPSPLVEAVMVDAEKQGFLATKDSRITARLSRKLIDAAKLKTGIKSDSELVKYAIAQIATEDPFKKAFRELRGTVDPDIDLEP